MIIKQIKYTGGGYEDCALNEWDFKKLELAEVDEVAYTYGSGFYEGTGLMVWRKGDKYGYQYLGHCSCYGPTEDIGTSLQAWFPKEDLEKLAAEAEEQYKEVYEQILRTNEVSL